MDGPQTGCRGARWLFLISCTIDGRETGRIGAAMSDATKAGPPPEDHAGSPDPATATTAVTDEPKSPASPGDRSVGNSKGTVQSVRHEVTVRLVVWILFGVICALLPFAALCLQKVLAADPVTLHGLLEGGELFVVSGVLAGGALGELIGAAYRGEPSLVVVLAGFGCFATFAGNVMGYMVVETSNAQMIVSVSEWLFLFTLIASGVSIGTAAAE
jgi:hypothetical protein